MKILVINGPNINIIGIREKNIYGNKSYEHLCSIIEESFKNHQIDFVQSNSEGGIIDQIQGAIFNSYDGIVINPAAFTHYSYAIYDALLAVNIPKVEVHLSNIFARDDFRKRTITSQGVDAVICGFGIDGYIYAIESIIKGKYEKNN